MPRPPAPQPEAPSAVPAATARGGSDPAQPARDRAALAKAAPAKAARAKPSFAGTAPSGAAPPGTTPPETARDRFERIHAILRMRICLLDYPPGMRLSEQALAGEFGTSRTPLRRVLVRLDGEGLLQSVQGVGTFVTDPGPDELAPIYRLRLELAELLGVLDPRPPDRLLWRHLQALAAGVSALVARPVARRFGELNHEFFLALQQISANEPLRRINERLFFQTARFWLKALAAGQTDVGAEARIFGNEVEQVMAALALGDLRSAALIHRSHISMNFQRMLQAR